MCVFANHNLNQMWHMLRKQTLGIFWETNEVWSRCAEQIRQKNRKDVVVFKVIVMIYGGFECHVVDHSKWGNLSFALLFFAPVYHTSVFAKHSWNQHHEHLSDICWAGHSSLLKKQQNAHQHPSVQGGAFTDAGGAGGVGGGGASSSSSLPPKPIQAAASDLRGLHGETKQDVNAFGFLFM